MALGTYINRDRPRTDSPNIIQYGQGNLFRDITRFLDAYNNQVNEELAFLVDRSTDLIRGYGGTPGKRQVRFDESGVPPPSKSAPGQTLGFPLWREGQATQWTLLWGELHTPEEAIADVQDAALADTLAIQRSIGEALFFPDNYTWVDRFVDFTELDVVRLANADGNTLPPGPHGQVFNPNTHTHYLARAGGSLAASDIEAALITVREHYNNGDLSLFINAAQEGAIRAMNGPDEFIPFTPAVIINPTDQINAVGQLNIRDIYNRPIGVFGTMTAEVHVKPWVPANYMLALLRGPNIPKALVWRERSAGSSGMRLVMEQENMPLSCKVIQREYGLGVWGRVSAAVLYTGGTNYVAPTFE